MTNPQVLPPAILEHIRLYREDPEKARLWDSTPLGGPGILTTLLLTTVGRKSGEQKSTPLIYQDAGNGNFVVVASKKGSPKNPVWFLNLQAQAECEIQVGKDHHFARARQAEGEERERLWKVVTTAYPNYNEYQADAGDRQIPLVVLEPIKK